MKGFGKQVMRHGFIKVAAVTPDIKVADCVFNSESIIKEMRFCVERGVKIAVFAGQALKLCYSHA